MSYEPHPSIPVPAINRPQLRQGLTSIARQIADQADVDQALRELLGGPMISKGRASEMASNIVSQAMEQGKDLTEDQARICANAAGSLRLLADVIDQAASVLTSSADAEAEAPARRKARTA